MYHQLSHTYTYIYRHWNKKRFEWEYQRLNPRVKWPIAWTNLSAKYWTQLSTFFFQIHTHMIVYLVAFNVKHPINWIWHYFVECVFMASIIPVQKFVMDQIDKTNSPGVIHHHPWVLIFPISFHLFFSPVFGMRVISSLKIYDEKQINRRMVKNSKAMSIGKATLSSKWQCSKLEINSQRKFHSKTAIIQMERSKIQSNSLVSTNIDSSCTTTKYLWIFGIAENV